MLVNYQTTDKNENTNISMNSNTSRILSFNTDSKFKLLINKKSMNDKSGMFFTNYILSENNSTLILNDISPEEVIQKISNKTIENNIKNLLTYDYKNLFDESTLKNEAGTKNDFSVEYEVLKSNLMFSEKYSDNKGKNLLIKFDLNEKEGPFILDKNLIHYYFNCYIDKSNEGENDIFKNDISFLLDIKKLIKSIQARLENLKQKGIKDLNDEIFVPLLTSNLGIIISQNPNNPKLNLETMKMNFNSIVKQKFILKSILISFNISLSIDNDTLSLDKSQNLLINDIENLEKISDSVKDNITSCGSSNNYNSSKKSGSEKDPLDYNIKPFPFRKMSAFTMSENNDFISDSDYSVNYDKKNSTDLSYNLRKTSNISLNNFSQPKSRKKAYQKKQYKDFNYIGNKTFLCSKDTFSNILFNKFQDKSKSTCNLKILIEFLKIKLNRTFEEVNLFKFFNCFYRISSLSLKIPFFKTDGKIIEKTITPTLKQLNLVIKNSKLIKKLKEKHSDKIYIDSTSSQKEISFNIDGFGINIFENESLVKINYDEKKPYYLNDSLNDKLEQLMNISRYIRKINIKKCVDINKSFISVEWNFINGNNIFNSSFTSYYLFNSDLLGVLSDIKEKEFSFWLNSVEESTNKNTDINYRNIIYENYSNITNFINNINR